MTMMIRLLLLAVVIAGCVLLVATVGLLAVNWSQRVWSPVVSIFFGGTVTALFTTLALLQGETFTRHSATSLVFDDQAHLSAFITPSDDTPTQRRLSELSSLGRPSVPVSPVVKDGAFQPAKLAIEPPRNDDEMFAYSGELLQYFVFTEIVRLQRGGWRVGSLGSSVIPRVNRPPKLTHTTTYSGADLLRIVSTNRFSRGSLQQFSNETGRLSLPARTSVELKHIPTSPGTGPDRHQIILTKPAFFSIVIELQSIGAAEGLPRGVTVSVDQPHLRTVLFEVTSTVRFEKWTAGNAQTAELKDWAKWLLEEIERTLS